MDAVLRRHVSVAQGGAGWDQCVLPPGAAPALAAVILCLGLLRKTARAAGSVRNSVRMDVRNLSVSLSMLPRMGVFALVFPGGFPGLVWCFLFLREWRSSSG